MAGFLAMVLILALAGLLAPAGRAIAQPLPDPGDMMAYRGQNGAVFDFIVTGAGGVCVVWGTDIYTDDSCLRSAAVHAGVLTNGQTGVVSVRVLPGQGSYAGTTRNGVTTAPWGAWGGSYEFVSGAAVLGLTLSDSAVALTRTQAMSPVTATVTGGSGNYAFAVAPALPAGLTLDPATGTISGTPAVTWPQTTHTVTVTDLGAPVTVATATGGPAPGRLMANTASAEIAITVVHPDLLLQIDPFETVAVRRAPLPQIALIATGGSGSYSFAVDPPLGPGLSLDPATGLISGSPLFAQPRTEYTVTLTDTGLPTAQGAGAAAGPLLAQVSNSFWLTVTHPPLGLSISPDSLTTQVGAPMPTVTAAGSGGSESYSYAIDPPLPPGIGLDPATGIIAGTPGQAQGPTTYTVTVTDTDWQGPGPATQGAAAAVGPPTASASFTLTINPAPITLTLSPDSVIAVRGTAMATVTATATGGTGIYSFTVAPPLPAGVSLDPATGTISGTPTVAQPTTIHTVTAWDAGVAHAAAGPPADVQPRATAELSLTVVNPALGLSLSPDSVSVQRGTAMPVVTATVTGGAGPGTVYQFSVSPALPAGVSLDSATGTISGTPGAVHPLTTHTVSVVEPGQPAGGPARAQLMPGASAQLQLEVLDNAQQISAAFTGVTTAFIARRSDRLLMAEPLSWRLDRRRQVGAQGGTELALRANDDGLVLRFATAHVSPDRFWHVWAEGDYTDYRDRTGLPARRDGRFGLVSAGVDALVNPRLALGLMVQGDTAAETVAGLSRTSGQGWMVGPYLSAELTPGLFLSARVARGQTRNDATIDVFQNANPLFAGRFRTDRTLVRATLHGTHTLDNGLRLLPEVDLAWIRDRQRDYSVTDGLSALPVAGQTVETARLSLGGTLEAPLGGTDGRALVYLRPLAILGRTRLGGATTGTTQGSVELGLRTGPAAGWTGMAGLRYERDRAAFRALSVRLLANLRF